MSTIRAFRHQEGNGTSLFFDDKTDDEQYTLIEDPKLAKRIRSYLTEPTYYRIIRLDADGRVFALGRMIFTWGLFCDLDWDSYSVRYCYEGLLDALSDFLHWDGQGKPPGPWVAEK